MQTARLVILLGTWLLTAAAHAQHQDDNDEVRILVTFADPGMSNAARPGPNRPGYSRGSSSYLVSVPVKRAARRIATVFGLEMVDEWPIGPLKVYCQVYSVTSGVPVDALLMQLRAQREVESAQRLNQFEVSGNIDGDSADPYFPLQYNLQVLQLSRAHQWSLGKGARVSVIDTGADLNHPDLRNQIRDHRDFVNNAGDFSTDAHGTAIAGVIGASSGNGVGIVGIAPYARLDILRACWYGAGSRHAICDSFTLALALSYAIDSGTKVINLSLGGPPDALLTRLVLAAIDRGIVVVAAAQQSSHPGFPADVPGVIVVDVDEQPAPADSATLSAPGEEILVPVPGGGFDYASGSSLSAAQVSGIVALLTSLQPDISSARVRTLLSESRSRASRSVNACQAIAHLLAVTGCQAEVVAKTHQTD